MRIRTNSTRDKVFCPGDYFHCFINLLSQDYRRLAPKLKCPSRFFINLNPMLEVSRKSFLSLST
jgi:hypothetical protein